GLVVRRSREYLGFPRRNRSVAVDQLREYAAKRFDAQAQRSHVEKQEILDLAAEHAGLYGSANRDDFVGINPLVRILAKERFDHLLDFGDSGRASHQHYLVDLARLDARVRDRRAAGFDRSLQNIVN